MRRTHKLRCNIKNKKSYVLCSGKPDRRNSKVSFFWADCTCPRCWAKKEKPKPKKK